MRCGLIGRRLGHSYSCQIHHALADYSYELWELEPEELAGFLEKRDFAGINVTIPYKEQVIPYLDELSETARAIGAVNTVVNRNGRLVGDNTDLPGMLALIRRMRLTLAGKKVLILGTGGTSKTARLPRRSWHAAEIYRVSRCGKATPSPIAGSGGTRRRGLHHQHDALRHVPRCGRLPRGSGGLPPAGGRGGRGV